MRDMFDCFEDLYTDGEIAYIVRIIKNKKGRKPKYLYLYINYEYSKPQIKWTTKISIAKRLIPIPSKPEYEFIKQEIRNNPPKCMIFRTTELMYRELVKEETLKYAPYLMVTDKKETLWNKVKKLWKTFLIK